MENAAAIGVAPDGVNASWQTVGLPTDLLRPMLLNNGCRRFLGEVISWPSVRFVVCSRSKTANNGLGCVHTRPENALARNREMQRTRNRQHDCILDAALSVLSLLHTIHSGIPLSPTGPSLEGVVSHVSSSCDLTARESRVLCVVGAAQLKTAIGLYCKVR